MAGSAIGTWPGSSFAGAKAPHLAAETLGFIKQCARPDGGFNPSPDPTYEGRSDTGLSDLAAVTYAATLARTMGWRLPDAKRSSEFIQNHQQPDGSFINLHGKMDPKSDLAILYNTVQGVVALHAFGRHPKIDPEKVMARFFRGETFSKLPWYTTSFFPLFYAALARPFPIAYDRALREHQIKSQGEDGYLGDHVAATFHMAHYFRLLGQPTPKAALMVKRVLRDQKTDGGWNIKEPDWDVHACFDAVFILRQLGGESEPVQQEIAKPPAGQASRLSASGETEPVRLAIAKAADWALSCRNPDGGFGHYPGWHSDMDAVYFQFGTLIQAARVPGAKTGLADAHTLSWGHAMCPDRVYRFG
jgi:geranylgeranyl transferase type-2 subunit beta